MVCEDPVKLLPFEEICQRCREETANYRRRDEHDDRFCFDLFRRAIVDRNERAWAELHEIYSEQVHAWCRKAVTSQSVDVEELVAQAWERLWHYFGADKLRAETGTQAVLKYLKTCAGSAAIDAVRAQGKSMRFDETMADRGLAASAADELLDAANREAFWRVVCSHLKEEREQILIYLKYELDLKSAEVQARHPELFPTVKDVYSVTRNVLDRLERSEALRNWRRLESD